MTHIAGPSINMAGRILHRCMVCGAKLADSEGAAMPLSPDGSTPKFPTWPVDALVQVETGNPTRYSVLPDSDRIPADTCLEFA